MTLRQAMQVYGVVGLFGAVVLGPKGRIVIRTARAPDAPTDCAIRCMSDRGEVWLNIDNTEVLSTIGVLRA